MSHGLEAHGVDANGINGELHVEPVNELVHTHVIVFADVDRHVALLVKIFI